MPFYRNRHAVLAEFASNQLIDITLASDLSTADLLDYIETRRPDLRSQRAEVVSGSDIILQQIPVVDCGIQNDNTALALSTIYTE